MKEKKLFELTALNVKDVRDVPPTFKLTDNQQRVANYIKNEGTTVDRPALEELLSVVEWPCYYLDFESAKSAIPLWEGVCPHQQILTQYSLHVCEDLEAEPKHFEYLAPHTHDSRKELTKRLIEDLRTNGSIVVYSRFERTQIENLAELFPDLARSLLALTERIFDLEKAFKGPVGHPEFRGSTSTPPKKFFHYSRTFHEHPR